MAPAALEIIPIHYIVNSQKEYQNFCSCIQLSGTQNYYQVTHYLRIRTNGIKGIVLYTSGFHPIFKKHSCIHFENPNKIKYCLISTCIFALSIVPLYLPVDEWSSRLLVFIAQILFNLFPTSNRLF
jgi:hypothetical protein